MHVIFHKTAGHSSHTTSYICSDPVLIYHLDNMPRKSSLRCYFGCNVDGPLHQFPTDRYPYEERFNTWKAVLTPSLQERGNKYIRENLRLCYRHFEEPYQLPSRRLTANSIPTLQLQMYIKDEPRSSKSSDWALLSPSHDAELVDLGDVPLQATPNEENKQFDLSVQLQPMGTPCSMKVTNEELLNKYLEFQNSSLIGAPALNPELKAANSALEDKANKVKQKQLASAMSCISEALTILMSAEEENTTLIKLLTDASKILCDIQNTETDTG